MKSIVHKLAIAESRSLQNSQFQTIYLHKHTYITYTDVHIRKYLLAYIRYIHTQYICCSLQFYNTALKHWLQCIQIIYYKNERTLRAEEPKHNVYRKMSVSVRVCLLFERTIFQEFPLLVTVQRRGSGSR